MTRQTQKAGAVAPLTEEEEAFIRAYARTLIAVPRAFDADLMREQGMSMNEYGVLMHLSEAPSSKLRMSDLAAASALSVSGMTRIVTRLEAQGLVRRERCATDARGLLAVLTEAGLRRLRAAWPSHVDSVRRHILDHLGEVDLRVLAEAMRRFAADTDTPLHER